MNQRRQLPAGSDLRLPGGARAGLEMIYCSYISLGGGAELWRVSCRNLNCHFFIGL